MVRDMDKEKAPPSLAALLMGKFFRFILETRLTFASTRAFSKTEGMVKISSPSLPYEPALSQLPALPGRGLGEKLSLLGPPGSLPEELRSGLIRFEGEVVGAVRIDKSAPRGLRVGMLSVSSILTDNDDLLLVESVPCAAALSGSVPLPPPPPLLPSDDNTKVDSVRDDEGGAMAGGVIGCGLQFINGDNETTAVGLLAISDSIPAAAADDDDDEEEDEDMIVTLPLDFVRRINSTPLFSCTSPSRYSKV